MTIFFPDLSHYQGKMSIAGSPALIAKATEGGTYTDPSYAYYRDQARTAGIPFAAYHFLRHNTTTAAQVLHAFDVVGTDTPLMLDVETAVDGTKATLADVLAFVDAYRAQGGKCTLIYLPKWYWRDHWGQPSLQPLIDRGLALISSNYVSYSETGPGWSAYGGMAPTIWQYTSSQPFNGQAVDFNGFRGTVEELRAVFNGGEIDVPVYFGKGSKGDHVVALQTRLITMGQSVGVTGPDGKYGDNTAAALKAAIAPWAGGIPDGSYYGPGEREQLDIAFARKFGGGGAGIGEDRARQIAEEEAREAVDEAVVTVDVKPGG